MAGAGKEFRIGVVAHEIVHVDRRHAIDALLKQQRRRIWLSVLLVAAKAGNLAGNVASLAEQMYTLKYSRGDEEQADTGAVDMCQKAGYNPAGILLAMYKISRFESESGGAPPKIFSDHPPTKERLQFTDTASGEQGHLPTLDKHPDRGRAKQDRQRPVRERRYDHAQFIQTASGRGCISGDARWLGFLL